ncbi:MAG: hypothetical protein IH891_02855, partial [Planctomycetes bacterium]|nr:hypothetical protein [Planctomycetota bacterium]
MKKIFGTRNQRLVKRYLRIVDQVSAFEDEIRTLSDPELRAKTDEFRRRLAEGESDQALIPEVFAVAREAMDRAVGIRNIFNPDESFDPAVLPEDMQTLYAQVKAEIEKTEPKPPTGDLLGSEKPVPSWMFVDIPPELYEAVRQWHPDSKPPYRARPFDVQIIGAIVLYEGRIAEMKTGEGKTIVAPLACYLAALQDQQVHVVTVNDYLAARDAEWMGQIYKFLGLTVGVIVPELSKDERRLAYAADITYGTNNEFGFDYLRDNLAFRLEDMVQRPFHYAIVDEVDSILIDEARTPLIISGPTEDKSQLYITVDRLVGQLGPEDYEKDEKVRAITLTEEGTERIEQLLNKAKLLETDNLYDYENTLIVHHVNSALKARQMFERDTDYIVKDGRVIIIDEFTGRMMEGRRYSDGLHQALEAKEGANIQPENQTLASITFQNYFRMYPKLAGMTGTAATEAEEFANIYALLVTEIPTHEPVIRLDDNDEFYRTADEKFAAIIDEIKDCRERGQPVLVGTVSIEKSEHLSDLLKKHKVPHNVLNARYHEQEAQIIAQAGVSGTVTIATNMAGRGTDIQLGGN